MNSQKSWNSQKSRSEGNLRVGARRPQILSCSDPPMPKNPELLTILELPPLTYELLIHELLIHDPPACNLPTRELPIYDPTMYYLLMYHISACNFLMSKISHVLHTHPWGNIHYLLHAKHGGLTNANTVVTITMQGCTLTIE